MRKIFKKWIIKKVANLFSIFLPQFFLLAELQDLEKLNTEWEKIRYILLF